jgi:hypothetical protein
VAASPNAASAIPAESDAAPKPGLERLSGERRSESTPISLEHRRRVLPYKDPSEVENLVHGLRKAGVVV